MVRLNADRRGFALVLCLLVALALSLLSAGMLVLAEREVAIARAAFGVAAARTRAEGAARRALARWSTREVDALPLGASRVILAEPDVTVRAERVAANLFLLRSVARHHAPSGAPASARAGMLVRTLDAAELGKARSAAAAEELAEIRSGTISGYDACSADAIAGLTGEALRIGSDAALRGNPPAVTGSPAPLALQALPLPALADIELAHGVGSPKPVAAAGVCEPDAWNWGSPDPHSPCRARVPLIHSPGDLVLTGGEGQGVLVVEGDLSITGSFVFRGLVLVTGRLTLDDPGALLGGHVRARELLVLQGTAEYDSCAIRTALQGPAFDRGFRPATRWWVPLF